MNSAMSFQPAFNPGTQANIPGLLTAISQENGSRWTKSRIAIVDWATTERTATGSAET